MKKTFLTSPRDSLETRSTNRVRLFELDGSLPLLIYALSPLFLSATATAHDQFLVACIGTAVVLFFLGTWKSRFSSKSWWYSGLEFTLLGSACTIHRPCGYQRRGRGKPSSQSHVTVIVSRDIQNSFGGGCHWHFLK